MLLNSPTWMFSAIIPTTSGSFLFYCTLAKPTKSYNIYRSSIFPENHIKYLLLLLPQIRGQHAYKVTSEAIAPASLELNFGGGVTGINREPPQSLASSNTTPTLHYRTAHTRTPRTKTSRRHQTSMSKGLEVRT